MSEQPVIAFIGLGIMGQPMARNLLQAGYRLRVYNRTRGKAEALAGDGATVCDSPAEAARGAQVVITIVTDTPDVEAVLFGETGVVAGAERDAVVVDMSTISPEATRDFAARLREHDLRMCDAPVSGGDVGAENGTLTIMVGGEADDVERLRSIFEVLGARVTHVGPHGAGQATKACNQVLCAVNMVAVCEALSLGASLGLDLHTLLAVVTGGAGNSWALEKLGPRIADGDLDPGFMVRLIQKDLGIVMDSAAAAAVPLPGTSLAQQMFRAVEADGHGALGTQAMIEDYERLAVRRVQRAGQASR